MPVDLPSYMITCQVKQMSIRDERLCRTFDVIFEKSFYGLSNSLREHIDDDFVSISDKAGRTHLIRFQNPISVASFYSSLRNAIAESPKGIQDFAIEVIVKPTKEIKARITGALWREIGYLRALAPDV